MPVLPHSDTCSLGPCHRQWVSASQMASKKPRCKGMTPQLVLQESGCQLQWGSSVFLREPSGAASPVCGPHTLPNHSPEIAPIFPPQGSTASPSEAPATGSQRQPGRSRQRSPHPTQPPGRYIYLRAYTHTHLFLPTHKKLCHHVIRKMQAVVLLPSPASAAAWLQVFDVAPDMRARGDLGRVHISVPQSHTQEPFAQPELIDKLIPEHPAARRDALDQRPPGQPPPLQSEFLLRPAPAGKVGRQVPADFSGTVCWGSSLCLPRRDARRR